MFYNLLNPACQILAYIVMTLSANVLVLKIYPQFFLFFLYICQNAMTEFMQTKAS